MPIPDAFLQELKFRCDMESVVSRYVNLKKSGRGLVGLCPFHSEKTPSFHVSTEQQFFHCFGCGAGGDVITFIMKIENLEYIDALKFLADMAGIPFPEDQQDNGFSALRKKILEINREAARFYYSVLTSSAGEKGMNYFKNRKLSIKTIRRFGLGYAPDAWDSLLNHMKKAGYREEDLETAALIVKSKRTGGWYDQFRNRVMFPIIDVRGNVIAFGGRVLDDSKPKYLNSPDTPVFKKSRCLYALNRAKNGNNNTMILCEGYMDVIALHQAGFSNAVATLGTALTPEQSRLMARYAGSVILSYDADAAGQAASQRAIRLLTDAGLSIRVLKIEEGKDPDEYIKSHGALQFKKMLEKSRNHIEFRLGQAKSKYDVAVPEQKVAYLKEAAGILATVGSAVEREVYAARLTDELAVSKEAILSEAAKIAKRNRNAKSKTFFTRQISKTAGSGDRINKEKSANLRAANAEERLLMLLYKNPDYLKTIDPIIRPSDFVTSFNRRVFESMRSEILTYGEADLSRLAMEFTPDEMGEITSFLHKEASSNTWEEASACAGIIKEEAFYKNNSDSKDEEAVFEIIRKKKMEEKKKTGGNHS